MPIDRGDKVQLLRQVIQGGRGGEVAQDNCLGFGGLRRDTHGARDVLGLAEVFLPDDFGFAIDSLTFAGIPVRVAPDDLLVQADGHALGHTSSRSVCQDLVACPILAPRYGIRGAA